ncbi:MAG: class I SAM-dependent methyltransferase [Alphaproteobacteria bacterium]|nr:class I SAM-dependent methyltransferase [Alphaproteobacteria bacterium]
MARTAVAERQPAMPGADERDPYIPLKIRFKAWWEGVDPLELMRGADPARAAAAAKITVDPPADEPLGPWPPSRVALCRRLWDVDEDDEVVEPGGAAYTAELYKPMGLDSTKSGFDLSAGLGGGIRKLAKERDLWLTGYELEPDLAAEAMRLSTQHGMERRCPIKPLDEEALDLGERRCDGVMLRERLHRIRNKQKLLDDIFTALKPYGHLVLTDLVLESESAADHPVVAGWLKRAEERAADGSTLHLWTKADVKKGILSNRMDLRIFEDETEKYLGLVQGGWARFVGGLTKAEMTRPFVDDMMREAEYWLYLSKALESGKLRYLRAHAIRGGETL